MYQGKNIILKHLVTAQKHLEWHKDKVATYGHNLSLCVNITHLEQKRLIKIMLRYFIFIFLLKLN